MLSIIMRWTTAVTLMCFNLSFIFHSASADQCSRNYAYKACVQDSGKPSSNHKLLSEKNFTDSDVQFPSDILCRCTFAAIKAGREYFAIRETNMQTQTIACYAISNYNQQSGKKNKISAIVDEMNELLSQNKCPPKCSKLGCIPKLGTGDYSAVYHVIPNTINLPPTTKTTPRIETLPPSTTHKPFWKPSPTAGD
ncbi:uncharacterized protein LOC114532771 [Dendronephthya gigantea]|uniref:uncharacterized protein LOC114532771 n=1 Tax=Dendronephthya gigantea TaxID=151771 RepID=UPI00106C1415|nr:uncharacterized protein LOC114532771 [Dendronephthya gigantea]